MFEGEDLGSGNSLKIWIVIMNFEWFFSFVDRNLFYVDLIKKKIK